MITAEWVTSLCINFDGVSEHPHFVKKAYKFKNRIFATIDCENQKLSVKLSEIDQSVFCDFMPVEIYPANGAWGKQGWTVFEFKNLKPEMLTDALTLGYEIISGHKK